MKPRKPFQFRHFTVAQEQVTMPVTTDACLFGMLVDGNAPAQILDIGTGTGLLALIMAQRFQEARITGIELDKATAETAVLNFSHSPWKHRLHGVFADILTWQTEQKFDLIISNPPFFEGQLPSENPLKRQARHTVTLDYASLISKIAALLNPQGTCWLLLPCLHEQAVRSEAAQRGLYTFRQIFIRATAEKQPHIVVLGLSPVHIPLNTEDLIVYESPGNLTAACREILRPLYLDQGN